MAGLLPPGPASPPGSGRRPVRSPSGLPSGRPQGSPSHRPAVVHLLGFAGVGKRTIGAALVDLVPRDEHRFVLVDNHLTGNAVIAAVHGDSRAPIDPRVWPHVHEVRAHVMAAITELGPPGWTYVFTNLLVDEVPSPTLGRIRALAEHRSAPYVPVVLHCAEPEHRRRIDTPERAAGHKWTDPRAVRHHAATHTLTRPDSPHLLDLDVTTLAPAEAAERIRAHLDRVLRPGPGGGATGVRPDG